MAANNLIAKTEITVNDTVEKIWDALVNPDVIEKYMFGTQVVSDWSEGSEIVETNIEEPYEIHLAEFATDKDFENFMHDEERKQFLHLKEQSIKSVTLIKGTKI